MYDQTPKLIIGSLEISFMSSADDEEVIWIKDTKTEEGAAFLATHLIDHLNNGGKLEASLQTYFNLNF